MAEKLSALQLHIHKAQINMDNVKQLTLCKSGGLSLAKVLVCRYIHTIFNHPGYLPCSISFSI